MRAGWVWLMGERPLDDRGRPTRVAFVGGYPAALWSRIHKMPADVHRRVRARCQRVGWELWKPGVVLAAITVVPWMALAIGSAVWMRPLRAYGMWTAVVGPFSGQMLFMVLFIWWSQRRVAPWLIRAMTEERYCPACRYALVGARADVDGCTVCPECGGAWRLPGVGGEEQKVGA